MNRYAILLGKPAPKPAPQPKIKYYLGMDVGITARELVIAISHFEGDKIIIDYIGRGSEGQIPEWLSNLNQKYPITYGLRDGPRYISYPTPFKIEFVKSDSNVRQKINQIFEANRHRMEFKLEARDYSQIMTQDVVDAVTRSVYLTEIHRNPDSFTCSKPINDQICFFDSSS